MTIFDLEDFLQVTQEESTEARLMSEQMAPNGAFDAKALVLLILALRIKKLEAKVKELERK